MDKKEKLLEFIAETLILIVVNQLGDADKLKDDGKRIIHKLKDRLIEIHDGQ